MPRSLPTYAALTAIALLSACAGLQAVNGGLAGSDPSAEVNSAEGADRTVIPRFENGIARSLLVAGKELRPSAGAPFQDTTDVANAFAEHAMKLRQSVDFTHLYPNTELSVNSFLAEVETWQGQAAQADAIDGLRKTQYAENTLRALFGPAANWESLEVKLEAVAALSSDPSMSLPAGWNIALLEADLHAAMLRHKHEFAMSTDLPPFALNLPMPRSAADALPLPAPAYSVLLKAQGHEESPEQLHKIAQTRVQARMPQTSTFSSTAAAVDSEQARQNRLTELARGMNQYLDQVETLTPATGLADLLIWRVEPGRETAAPMFEYVASTKTGVPAVLYVNLSEVHTMSEEVLELAAAEAILGHHLAAAWGFRHAAGWAAFITHQQSGDDSPAWATRELERWVWLAVDAGLHGGSWSEADARLYAAKATGLSESMVETEVRAILNQPSRAASFLPTFRTLMRWQQRLNGVGAPKKALSVEQLRRILGAGDVAAPLLNRALALAFNRSETQAGPAPTAGKGQPN